MIRKPYVKITAIKQTGEAKVKHFGPKSVTLAMTSAALSQMLGQHIREGYFSKDGVHDFLALIEKEANDFAQTNTVPE